MDNVRCIRSEPPKCCSDRNCEGPEKCCYLHCGFKCVQPVKTIEEVSSPHSSVRPSPCLRLSPECMKELFLEERAREGSL